MHRPRWPGLAGRRRNRPRNRRPEGPYRAVLGRRLRERAVGTHGVAEQLLLVDGLVGARVLQGPRAVGRQQEHRHPGVGRLHHRGVVVGDRGAGGADQRRRLPGGLRPPQREEGRRPLVDVGPRLHCGMLGERVRQRGTAAPRREADVTDAAPDELLHDDAAPQRVPVGGVRGGGLVAHGRRPRWRSRMAWSMGRRRSGRR